MQKVEKPRWTESAVVRRATVHKQFSGESVRIKDLPSDERPRERLMQLGAEALSNRELLAVLLRTGTRCHSALDVADRLLADFQSIRSLAEASVEELCVVPGIGNSKAVHLLAAFELAKRLQHHRTDVLDVIQNPGDAADLVMEDMRRLDREHFVVLMLNTKHHVMARKVVSIGHLNGSLVHPRELFKEVIRRSSAAVILVHNHPSGDPTPSEEDLAVTRRLVEAGNLLGISVLDHVIVGEKRYVSLREKGFL